MRHIKRILKIFAKMNVKEFAVVDLFCGVGGLSHGFVQKKFPVIAGIDFDKTCEYAYKENNKAAFIHADINNISIEQVNELYPKGARKILVGCAPCQPFSSYTSPKHKKEEQWSLLNSFGRLVRGIEPDIVSMENVVQLRNFNDGEIFLGFVRTLEDLGYAIWHDIVKVQDYGVPQSRKRLVLIASKIGKIELKAGSAKKGRYKTLFEAIGKLPPLQDGQSDPNDPLHRARKLSELNKLRIKATPEGGSWQDWPDHLRLECHKKDTGKSYKSVYGRMRWKDIAPTMTTQCTGLGNGRFGHPEQDRAISLREAAIIQSFPNDYKFFDPKSKWHPTWVERHIGNAVPVGLAKAIAESIQEHIQTL